MGLGVGGRVGGFIWRERLLGKDAKEVTFQPRSEEAPYVKIWGRPFPLGERTASAKALRLKRSLLN